MKNWRELHLPVKNWRPHGDSNPGSHRERVVSWTRLDDRDGSVERRNVGPDPARARVFFPSLQPRFFSGFR